MNEIKIIFISIQYNKYEKMCNCLRWWFIIIIPLHTCNRSRKTQLSQTTETRLQRKKWNTYTSVLSTFWYPPTPFILHICETFFLLSYFEIRASLAWSWPGSWINTVMNGLFWCWRSPGALCRVCFVSFCLLSLLYPSMSSIVLFWHIICKLISTNVLPAY